MAVLTTAEYLIVELGNIASLLEWTDSTAQIDLAIEQATVLADGDTDALRPIALALVWEKALIGLATLYDWSADKASYKQSQVYQMASSFYRRSLSAAGAFLPSGAVIGGFIETDPYVEADSGAEFS